MKYRIVNVYTGYAENSIQGEIKAITGNDVTKVTRKVMKNRQLALIVDGVDLDTINEFYNHMWVSGGVGRFSWGEENVVLVIPEESVWYDRVIDDDLYEKHGQAWNDLVWEE